MSGTTASIPRASITLMPLADTLSVTLRRRDGTEYVFFCTFGSKRRFVRRCECEMLWPKPGTAPVPWHTAAIVFLQYRGADASPKISCLRTRPHRAIKHPTGVDRANGGIHALSCGYAQPAREPSRPPGYPTNRSRALATSWRHTTVTWADRNATPDSATPNTTACRT